jgi:xylan 1,4-beta-xylosidase
LRTRLFTFPILCSTALAAPVQPSPFAFDDGPEVPVTYTNPVIPGFYSDPSVCRVENDYYLVTSTFEYFPGVPVFHSRDLVNWEQIGHCIDRPDQIPQGMNIFTCTIRYHNGTFYMITTNPGMGGSFYVTATDPAGPWSDPVWIDVPAIDPDLFFDDDGKTYVTTSAFSLYEIDLQTGEILTEGRQIWYGTGGRYMEGPHIYK